MKSLLVPAVCLCVVLSPHESRAQGCCTPGSSPLRGIGGPALPPGQFEVGYALSGFELDQGYRGSERIEDPGGRTSRVLSQTVYTRVGLPRRLSIVAEFPVDYRMREQSLPSGNGFRTFRFSNTAAGDFSTLLLATVWPVSGPSRNSLGVGLGVKWPTGPDDARQDGLILPIELQSGTGTIDPLVAVAATRSWTWGGVNVAGAARIPTRADSGYRYGREVNAVLLASRGVGNFRVGPEIRSRFAGANDFDGHDAVNTGAGRVMAGVNAGLNVLRPRLSVEGSYLLPLWQSVNGVQLGVSREFRMDVRWSP